MFIYIHYFLTITKVINLISSGILSWDIKKLAEALKIRESDVREYFTDGRRVSFILERRIAYERLSARLPESEGADYDLIDDQGGKWEVRSVSASGIYFCPSYMVGSGRSFNVAGFIEKTRNLKGYVIADIERFPEIRYWIIEVNTVLKWWNQGELGTTTKISRNKFLSLINNL